jgi:hypothetical protein
MVRCCYGGEREDLPALESRVGAVKRRYFEIGGLELADHVSCIDTTVGARSAQDIHEMERLDTPTQRPQSPSQL